MTGRRENLDCPAALGRSEQLQASHARTDRGPHEGGFPSSSWRSYLGELREAEDALDQPEVTGDEAIEDPYRFRSIRVPLNVLRKWLFVRLPSLSPGQLVDAQPPGANSAMTEERRATDDENERCSAPNVSFGLRQAGSWQVALWIALAMGMAVLIGIALLVGLPLDWARPGYPRSTPPLAGTAEPVNPVEAREAWAARSSSSPSSEKALGLPLPSSPRSIKVFPVSSSVTSQRRAPSRAKASRSVASREDTATEPGSGWREPSTSSREDGGNTEVWTALHDPPED